MSVSTQAKRLLVVDPDGSGRERVVEILLRAGYQVTALDGVEAGCAHLAGRDCDAVLVALGEPGSREGLQRLRQRAAPAPLLALCEPRRIRAAMKLLRTGFEDYLLYPPDPFELRARLERILERHDLDSRITFFHDEISKRSALGGLETRSPAMRAVLEQVLRLAPIRSTLLIQGESGVGKELVARSIHFNSPRRRQPFLALNCAAIPSTLIESELFGHERGAFTGAHARMRGKFEIAHRGTLFLDEIAEMEPAIQAKLLRVLEEKEFMRVGGDHSVRVDVRLIAATNADLDLLVSDGRFRRDLYYRLKVVTLRVPPLRERREDLPFLVATFLDQLSRANAVERKSIGPEALEALLGYDWPGNVRELKNLLESLLVSVPGSRIAPEHLPAHVHGGASRGGSPTLEPGARLADMERELIRRTLEHTGGNRTHSAALLDIGVRTLQRKIRLYGLRIAPTRRRPRAAPAPRPIAGADVRSTPAPGATSGERDRTSAVRDGEPSTAPSPPMARPGTSDPGP